MHAIRVYIFRYFTALLEKDLVIELEAGKNVYGGNFYSCLNIHEYAKERVKTVKKT